MAEAAPHLKEQLKSVSPCLRVDDVVKSAEYYRDVLGFHFDRYWGELACFVVLRGGCVLCFGQNIEK
jgi:catechol 2,3-dioxygenase-like lactoylglutathione lyase family enzyme